MSARSIPEYPNPFNPGFGVDPPYLAGRAGELHRVLANLADGPGRADYLTVLLGPRGVGKTVFLNQIRHHVEGEFGWPTIRWTAGPDRRLVDAVDERFDDVNQNLTGRRGPTIAGGEVSVGAGVGRASLRLNARQRPVGVHAQLRHLGIRARDANRHVVLLVDELQSGSAESLRALSSALQETNGERLPVGMVAVGLPTATTRLAAIEGVTFLERQATTFLGNLDHGDCRDALLQPLLAQRRDIADDELERLVVFTSGYPYAVQLVGYHTVEAAGDDQLLSAAHVGVGIERARQRLDGIFAERWQRLSPAERNYVLAAVTVLDTHGQARTGAIAAELDQSPQQVSKHHGALLREHQLIYSPERGVIEFALPGFGLWVAGRSEILRAERDADAPRQAREHRQDDEG